MTSPLTLPTLTTQRLVLRRFTLDDAPAVHTLLSTPEISETTLMIAYPYPEGAAESWIDSHQEALDKGDGLTWAVTLRAGDTFMGAIGLHVDQAHARGSMGYWLGVPYWNKGYMSEAATAVTGWALGALGLHRVEAQCFTRNPASARVMEHAGLHYEGTMEGSVRKNGRFEDVAIYARLADSDSAAWEDRGDTIE
jgi:[ribosomal protein S5]-alanine N-acetyltransferase